MTRLRALALEVWVLTKGYWGSEERWPARAFLTAIVAFNLGLVGVNILQNKANGALFTTLQQRDAAGFYRALGVVVALVFLYLTVATFRVVLDQTLQLRWRRWLTERYVTRWLGDRAFYRMRFAKRVDNPDQRISEDVRLYIERTMALGLGVLNALATLASFAALLWSLSGPLALPVNGITITIPGYLFWVAVLYSGVGSVTAHAIGRPLIRLNNRQQEVEADFRFGLVHLREEAEGIALYGGEARERGIALRRFQALYDNVKRIIVRSNQYLFFQLLCSQFPSWVALLIASPRYFSGAIQLGVLIQTANAFERVNEALSWFIGSYTAFAEWRATADRLTQLSAEIEREKAADRSLRTEAGAQDALELRDVAVSLPDGAPMLHPVTLRLEAHEPVLLKGPSGNGKSTLFRVVAGLWPFATGLIRFPAGARILFLPERPYMPIGTLREALWFPAPPAPDRDQDVLAALASVGLATLGPHLDEEADWAQALSVGEQQRLAIVRALLIKPDWLFLDEVTAATDAAEEAKLYRTVASALPATTVVSIGNRDSLEAHHRRVIAVERAAGHPGRLVDHAGA